MFGIQNFVLKAIVIIAAGIVLICIATVAGCVPGNGREINQRQLALATKNNVDSSQVDNREDNSIHIPVNKDFATASSLAFIPAVQGTGAGEELVKLIEARAVEREKVILAHGRIDEMEIRAKEEKWRLLVWVVGIGAVVVALFALFIRSPLDWKVRR